MADEKAVAQTDFELLDLEDEQQILDDLRGIVTDKFVYKNKRGEAELSYAGTKWAVRKMAEQGEAIRIEGHPEIKLCPVDPEHIIVTVLARRVKVDRDSGREIALDSTVGCSRGWSKQKLLDGKIIPDEHYTTKTVSKATRNVQQALMPVEFKKAMIAELTGQKVTKAAKAPLSDTAKPVQKPAEPAPAAPAAPQKAAEAAKPPATTKKPSDDAGAVRQKLMAAFKTVVGPDMEKNRAYMKAWTGKDKSHDLDIPTMERLTAAIYKSKDGQTSISPLNIVDAVTGAVLFGVASPVAAQAAGVPDEEQMF